MTLLNPRPVDVRQFTYDDATRTFSAEMSDTNGLGRVWDDSCDEGLTLVADGDIVFVVTAVEHDAEGDVLRWLLASATGYRMILWND